MIKLRTVMATVAAVAMTASLGVTALAQDAEESPQPLGVFGIEDQTWILTGQVVDGEMQPVPDGVLVSIEMVDGQAAGTSGCNRYSTTYELDGFSLTFGPTAGTLMACPSPADAVEQAYLANLGLVVAYQSGGIQMAMLDENGDFLLEWDLAPQATIVGSWVAQSINNGTGGVVSSATTSAVTADYAESGELTGNDGCNDYSTTYEVDGDSITISETIASTRMACTSDELAEQSQQYYAALGAASTWSVDVSGILELREADDSLQVSYGPAAE